MAQNTPIEWADKTWNPIRGCSKVSEGCRNCYAMRVAARFAGKGQPYEGLAQITNGQPNWTGKVAFVESVLDQPLRWKAGTFDRWVYDSKTGKKVGGSGEMRPLRIFVNSMSDLFHKSVPDEWIDRIFAVMALAQKHNFLILTKRPARMMQWFNRVETNTSMPVQDSICGVLHDHYKIENPNLPAWPLPNVWLGVSVEDQGTADERIPLLMQTPAAVRFVSYEPALGPVDLSSEALRVTIAGTPPSGQQVHPEAGGIGWVICGGESGPDARPMKPEWARSVRDQCHAGGVPFFFKQWGEWEPTDNKQKFTYTRVIDGEPLKYTARSIKTGRPLFLFGDMAMMERVGKKNSGRLLDGREWNEFPQNPGNIR